MHRLTLPSLLLALVTALIGCASDVGSNGAKVGGDCVVSSECDPASRCITGATDGTPWTDGYCTLSCDSTEGDEAGVGGCPAGAVCGEVEGGLCLVECAGDGDCREGYTCAEVERRGAGGSVNGCVAAGS